jgi:hypothetical protein
MAGRKKGKGLGGAGRGPSTPRRRSGQAKLGANGGGKRSFDTASRLRSTPAQDERSLSQAERELRGLGERPRLVRNKRRAIQVAPTRRKLFKGKVKKCFLEWFAATANISLSARKAGIHYRTVLRHRMEDPVFAADMERALEVGIVRVRAWALELGEEAGTEFDAAAVDMKPVNLTPDMALQLLREHERRQAAALKGTAFGPRPGRAPTVATSAEVQAALVKALRAYGDRLRAGDAPSALPEEESSPSTGSGRTEEKKEGGDSQE